MRGFQESIFSVLSPSLSLFRLFLPVKKLEL